MPYILEQQQQQSTAAAAAAAAAFAGSGETGLSRIFEFRQNGDALQYTSE